MATGSGGRTASRWTHPRRRSGRCGRPRGRCPIRLELGSGQVQGAVRGREKSFLAADLHKLWNAQKKTDPALAWWAENSKCCYQEAFRNLERALGDFIKSKKGQRKGKRLGFPRYKKGAGPRIRSGSLGPSAVTEAR